MRDRAARNQARLDSGQGSAKDLQALQHELDVLVGLRQLALHVPGSRSGVDDLRLQRSELAPGRLDRRGLRQRRLRVGDLVETRVDGLQVEQAPLAGRVGFQDTPPGS